MDAAAIGYGNASQNIGTKTQVLRRKKNAGDAAHETVSDRFEYFQKTLIHLSFR